MSKPPFDFFVFLHDVFIFCHFVLSTSKDIFLKKFLQKLPNGIFGPVNEDKLFQVMLTSRLDAKEKVEEVSK